MKTKNLDITDLSGYVRSQIGALFPIGSSADLRIIDTHIGTALTRLETCISGVKVWRPGEFDILHSSQYCTFLYYLSNTIWRAERATRECTLLFLLNKALNAIDCFYEIELPEVFFIGHSVGIVLAKATYGNYLVLYQNSTIGKNHGQAPVLGDRVILYPNSAVIGNCRIGSGSVISQGVSVISRDTPENQMVFQGNRGDLVFQTSERQIFDDFFR